MGGGRSCGELKLNLKVGCLLVLAYCPSQSNLKSYTPAGFKITEIIMVTKIVMLGGPEETNINVLDDDGQNCSVFLCKCLLFHTT